MPSVPREKYPEMNWRAADKVATRKVFKQQMEVIFVADQIPEERQWALILVAGGDEAYNHWDTLEDTVKDRKVVKQVWDTFEKSFEQSTDDGMLLKGPRLIIPGELQEEYLSRLHEGHLSANKVQENAKQHMYWTGIDADIEDYTKRCQECIKRSQVPKEPLQPHDIPEGPWRKLGIDYFAFDGNSYVLICDYFSKFPFLYRAKTSFWSLRDRLIDLFSIEGYPDEIVSDNGPPFQSKEFAKFLSGLGIKHTTSSPGYPHSNGFIERHIQTVKNMLSKSLNTRSFQEVLADLRTTRIGAGLLSPAEILHGRNLTTRAQAEIDIKAIRSVLQERQLKMMLDHDSSR